MKLKLEINSKFVPDSNTEKLSRLGIFVTPPIGKKYWKYRVRLSEKNAIVGFPKLRTIGIGFEQEVDWNTNLPFSCDANKIYEHIRHNGYRFKKERCVEAIKMIQNQIKSEIENET